MNTVNVQSPFQRNFSVIVVPINCILLSTVVFLHAHENEKKSYLPHDRFDPAAEHVPFLLSLWGTNNLWGFSRLDPAGNLADLQPRINWDRIMGIHTRKSLGQHEKWGETFKMESQADGVLIHLLSLPNQKTCGHGVYLPLGASYTAQLPFQTRCEAATSLWNMSNSSLATARRLAKMLSTLLCLEDNRQNVTTGGCTLWKEKR